MVRERWQRRVRHRGRSHPVEHSASPASAVIDGADVLIAGLFSAKREDYLAAMDAVAASVIGLGGRVTGRFVQRRGNSGNKKGNAPGGRRNMDRPYSRRILMSTGKIREIAEACAQHHAAAVVFYNELTDHQRTVLAEVIGCAVFSRHDL